LGTYETAMTTILVLFGVPSGTGTAVALLDHFVRLAVIFVIGSIAIVHIVFQSRPYFRKQRQTTDEEVLEERERSSTASTGMDRDL
jgi:hypothetical protein